MVATYPENCLGPNNKDVGVFMCEYVSHTCFQGLVWSWLGLHNTSSVVCTSCRPAETGRAGEEGSEGRTRW